MAKSVRSLVLQADLLPADPPLLLIRLHLPANTACCQNLIDHPLLYWIIGVLDNWCIASIGVLDNWCS